MSNYVPWNIINGITDWISVCKVVAIDKDMHVEKPDKKRFASNNQGKRNRKSDFHR